MQIRHAKKAQALLFYIAPRDWPPLRIQICLRALLNLISGGKLIDWQDPGVGLALAYLSYELGHQYWQLQRNNVYLREIGVAQETFHIGPAASHIKGFRHLGQLL